MFKSTIGRKAFGVSYEDLFGLGIMTVVDTLKYLGQCPKLMQASAMLMILDKHSSFLIISFQWRHVILSGPRVEESTHLLIADTNSNLEKGDQIWCGLHSTLFKTLMLTCRWSVLFTSLLILSTLSQNTVLNIETSNKYKIKPIKAKILIVKTNFCRFE